MSSARLTISLLGLALVAGVVASSTQGSGRAIGLDSSRSNRPATVWAVGNGDAYTSGQRVERLVESGHPDRFLYLGDVYENGTADDFQKNYRPSFGRIAKWTAPTPGNHEWTQHAQGYDVFWRHVLKKPIPQYYEFRIAGWDILSLNSEAPHDESSPQVRWLQSKVSKPGTCRLAFWHRPLYSDDQLTGDQVDIAPLWNALRGHAVLVLNAHDHTMERFAPVDGITELIVGSGGHGLHLLKTLTRRAAFSEDQSYGALRLILRPGKASYRFVAVGGKTLEAGTIRCKRLASKKRKKRR